VPVAVQPVPGNLIAIKHGCDDLCSPRGLNSLYAGHDFSCLISKKPILFLAFFPYN
jgi:hypothetical protein